MIDDDEELAHAIAVVVDQRLYIERVIEERGPRTARVRAVLGFTTAEERLRAMSERASARADEILARDAERRRLEGAR